MNSKCVVQSLLPALTVAIFSIAGGYSADFVTKDGDPANYEAVPDLKVLQARLQHVQNLTAQGKLTTTDILKDNVHNATVGSWPSLIHDGISAPTETVNPSAQSRIAYATAQSTPGASGTLTPYQSCSAIG